VAITAENSTKRKDALRIRKSVEVMKSGRLKYKTAE